jgi:hypothetical protein
MEPLLAGGGGVVGSNGLEPVRRVNSQPAVRRNAAAMTTSERGIEDVITVSVERQPSSGREEQRNSYPPKSRATGDLIGPKATILQSSFRF